MESTATLCLEYMQTGKCTKKEGSCKLLHYMDVNPYAYMGFAPFIPYNPQQQQQRINSKPVRFQKMCFDRGDCRDSRCCFYHQEDDLLESFFHSNTFHWSELTYRRCPICCERSGRNYFETSFDLIDVVSRPKTQNHCLRFRCRKCGHFRYLDSRSLQEMNEEYFMIDAPPNASLPPAKRPLSHSAPPI